MWNPAKKILLQTYNGHGYEVLDAKGSIDNSRLASCGMDRMVFLWDVTHGQPIRRYRGHAGHVNCVSFNDESSVLLSGSVDCSVRAWDCKSNSREPIQTMNDAKDSVSSICASDQEIVVASLDNHIRIYDLRKGLMYADDMLSKLDASFGWLFLLILFIYAFITPFYLTGPANYVHFTKDKLCILVSCIDGN